MVTVDEYNAGVAAGTLDPETGSAYLNEWGADASIEVAVEPLHSDHTIRWDRLAVSEANGKGFKAPVTPDVN